MRLQPTLIPILSLCLSTYAREQQQEPQQHPLGSWFSKLSSYIPSLVSNPADVLRSHSTSDAAAAAAAIAATRVTPLTLSNWRGTLKKNTDGSDDVEEWWVLITGGNRTCVGGQQQCEKVERAWNETAVVFASSGPHQAILNCDIQSVLCGVWGSPTPPSIWHILMPPQPQREDSDSDSDSHHHHQRSVEIRILPVNASTVTAAEMVRIHTSKSWKELPLYTGSFQPFDSWLALTGLNVPLGYVKSVWDRLPTWSFMLLVSFLTRTFMSRRMAGQRQRAGQGDRPVGGQPRPT